MNESEREQRVYTYKDLVRRLYDLEVLAVPPQAGEKSGCFSSFDRRSVYNAQTGLYEDWGLMMTEEVSSVRKVRVLSPWNWMVLA